MQFFNLKAIRDWCLDRFQSQEEGKGLSTNDFTDEYQTAIDSLADTYALKEDVEECFQSVSNGKSLVASAITDKGVETAADATFETMANNIALIESGGESNETDSADAFYYLGSGTAKYSSGTYTAMYVASGLPDDLIDASQVVAYYGTFYTSSVTDSVSLAQITQEEIFLDSGSNGKTLRINLKFNIVPENTTTATIHAFYKKN